jgi:hypothetical protein
MIAPRQIRGHDPLFKPASALLQASLENKLIPEGHLYTSRGLVDEHGLFGPTLDIFPIDEGAVEQQVVEQVEDKDNDKDKGPQQEVNGVAEVVTAERAGDTYLSNKANRSSRPTESKQLHFNHDPSLTTSHDEAECDIQSNDELNSTGSDEDNGKTHPMQTNNYELLRIPQEFSLG